MDDKYLKLALILEEVKRVLNKATREDPMDSFNMIDLIQRFGLESHFEEEIAEALKKHHLILCTNKNQLHEVALQFRLLRQGGHYVHPGVFKSFMSIEGKLKEKCSEDIKGLVALYEASQLSIDGEGTLEKVGNLSYQLLDAWLSRHQDHPKAKIVANTLQHPLHQSWSRIMDWSILLNDFHFKKGLNSFEELIEINSSIVKSIYQNEIIEVFKWWEDLEIAKKMKFPRYEPLKWYLWPMASLVDPRFSEQRIEFTKAVSLVYIIDDIFDVHGTSDELTLFTDAVNRWELAITEQLPDYMKITFNVLRNIINELATKVQKKHGLNPADILWKSWARLLNSFLVESEWLNSGHLPKAEDYLKNGIVSTGVHVVLVHAFFLLDDGITRETVAILDYFPSITSSVAQILRLCDDLEGAKSKDQKGLDGSYLDCYMNENQGISIEDTQRHVAHLISSSWKRLNQEVLTPDPFPSSFAKVCLNAARMISLMYNYGGDQSSTILQKHMKTLLNIRDGLI